MKLLPIPLFFTLQLFTSLVWSQGTASPTISLAPPSTFPDTTGTSTSSTNSIPSSSVTGTANASSTSRLSISASSTSTAQFPSLSGVSSCVSGCLAEGSARLNCTSVVDVNCFCVNSRYPAEIVACVLANCSSEITTIESLGQQFCNIASGHPTLSFPTLSASSSTSPSTSIPTSTSTATKPPTTSSSTGAASSWNSMNGSTVLIGLGVLLVLQIGVIVFGV